MKAYTFFTMKGRNLEKALAKIQRNNIALYDIKRQAADMLRFKTQTKDEQKIFALFNGSCYNIRVLKRGGALYPLLALYKNTGVMIGAAVFLLMLIISNFFMYGVDIKGDAHIYTAEIESILKENYAYSFSPFKKLDLKKLERNLYKLEGVEFVSAGRRGNRLILDIRLTADAAEIKVRENVPMVAAVSGEIVSISVIRGTGLVKTGDEVIAGDILIGAYYVDINENQRPTFTIGRAEIKASGEVLYKSDLFDDGAKADALAYAKFSIDGSEIIDAKYSEVIENDIPYIKVTFSYIQIVTAN